MDLCYSVRERILFYVASHADNTHHVEQIIQDLTEGANKLVEVSFEDKENISTFVVTHSGPYKGRRVFWVRTDNIPENTKKLTGSYTMEKWLYGD